MPAGIARTWTGDEWQAVSVKLLGQYLLNQGRQFQPIPDRTHGDGGLEGYSFHGEVFQCFAPKEYLTLAGLLDAQKRKLKEDIGKFIADKNGKIAAMLKGKRKISRWVFVTPYVYSKELLIEAAKQEERVRQAALSYVTPNDFAIPIMSAAEFWREWPVLDAEDAARTATFLDPWAHTVWSSPLWGKSPPEENRRFAAQLASICWRWWGEKDAALAANPWRDFEYAPRAAALAGDLWRRVTQDADISPQECAALLTAPFLREAVLAQAERKMLAIPDALVPDETAMGGDGAVRTLRTCWQKHAQLARKAAHLRHKRDMPDEADSIAWWLLRRAVMRLPKRYEPMTQGGCVEADFLAEITACAKAGNDPYRRLEFLHKEPLALAAQAGSDAAGRSERLKREGLDVIRYAPAGGGIADCQFRVEILAGILSLAAKLALDPMDLPEVLVDHVGLSEGVAAAEVAALVRLPQWEAGSDHSLILSLACRHAAHEAALKDHVAEAEALRRRLAASAALERLPVLSSARLRAAEEGYPAKPLYVGGDVRFTLDAEAVKDLLMGERLYGDPTLAIRELYQNALDACRYVEARRTYLDRTGRMRPEVRGWQGDIRFFQGKVDGRDVIECRDNGVGMDENVLSRCFANAGRRFTDTDEFIEEQAEWERHGVTLDPNSQFGVGVFSYFMLAEEIEIYTRRQRPDGTNGDGLHVRISGSGSLFRIAPMAMDRDPLEHGCGTLVRLYLSRTEYTPERSRTPLPISARDTLQRLLWLADFHTSVTEEDGAEIRWQPEVLRVPERFSNKRQWLTPSGVDDIWICVAEGEHELPILADGIATEEEETSLLINFRRGRRPSLSVDRKSIRKKDEGWLEASLAEIDWRAFLLQVKPSFLALSALAKSWPRLAEAALEAAEAMGGCELSLSHEIDGIVVDLARAGLSGGDRQALGFSRASPFEHEICFQMRNERLRDVVSASCLNVHRAATNEGPFRPLDGGENGLNYAHRRKALFRIACQRSTLPGFDERIRRLIRFGVLKEDALDVIQCLDDAEIVLMSKLVGRMPNSIDLDDIKKFSVEAGAGVEQLATLLEKISFIPPGEWSHEFIEKNSNISSLSWSGADDVAQIAIGDLYKAARRV